jgi:hypothetical protein
MHNDRPRQSGDLTLDKSCAFEHLVWDNVLVIRRFTLPWRSSSGLPQSGQTMIDVCSRSWYWKEIVPNVTKLTATLLR